ncbi:MAG: bifunctional 5,10-methylenetetrahydrofolate dehydrogenase/5,10-methenyltetrahydrofolate cyclohydrolase [bacterium]|nr:bifunctional 5,10-methylenetetrahydrofolate dehydrogenase/5,10-methenyltetrahydrofolate cyclohydrolase [bacterium]
MKISGTLLAKELFKEIQKKVEKLKKNEIVPRLIIVKSCDTEAVNKYVSSKIKKGKEMGIDVQIIEFSEQILSDRKQLVQSINRLNKSQNIHGIIFQKPGDDRIDESLEKYIAPIKDVDGFLSNTKHEPPTYRGVKLVFSQIYGKKLFNELKKKQFVIIGKGKTGGKPIIDGLLKDKINTKNIKIIDSKTSISNKNNFIKNADIIISAVGMQNPVDVRLFSKEKILIDIGVHFDNNNKIMPDFDEKDIQERVGYYTTTPGGIGALTVAFLMDNVVNSALLIHNKN